MTIQCIIHSTPSGGLRVSNLQDAKKGILWDDFDTSYVFVFR